MKPLTIEDTIQMGYNCGLATLDDAYQNVMHHYDCFFELKHFVAQKAIYDRLFMDRGYTDVGEDGGRFIKPLLIVDVAKDLGYELQELVIPQVPEDPEGLDNNYEIEGFE